MIALAYILGSYLLRNIMTAYIVGKTKGVNLQENGGNLGARNAGRVIGKVAFIITAVGDVAKGAIAVIAGRLLGLDEQIVALGLVAVVLGHLFPFWLKGKGGMGVATVLGAMLFFSWQAAIVFIVIANISYWILKSFTFAFIISLIAYAIALIVMGTAGKIYVIATIILVIWRHRENIMERVNKKKDKEDATAKQ